METHLGGMSALVLWVTTMLADSFRYILWAGRLQPLTYMFMIANNGRVEMSNHQGEFQYNQYTRRPSLLSPLPLPSPLLLVPHHHHSRMTVDPAIQGFLTEPCTGGK